MPRRSQPWSYTKKRRKKKDKIFMDDTNIDEETVTDSFVTYRQNAVAPSSSSSSPIILESNKKKKMNTRKRNILPSAASQSPSNADIAKPVANDNVSCDKIDGVKVVSHFQISPDDDEEIDRLNLLNPKTKILDNQKNEKISTSIKNLESGNNSGPKIQSLNIKQEPLDEVQHSKCNDKNKGICLTPVTSAVLKEIKQVASNFMEDTSQQQIDSIIKSNLSLDTIQCGIHIKSEPADSTDLDKIISTPQNSTVQQTHLPKVSSQPVEEGNIQFNICNKITNESLQCITEKSPFQAELSSTSKNVSSVIKQEPSEGISSLNSMNELSFIPVLSTDQSKAHKTIQHNNSKGIDTITKFVAASSTIEGSEKKNFHLKETEIVPNSHPTIHVKEEKLDTNTKSRSDDNKLINENISSRQENIIMKTAQLKNSEVPIKHPVPNIKLEPTDSIADVNISDSLKKLSFDILNENVKSILMPSTSMSTDDALKKIYASPLEDENVKQPATFLSEKNKTMLESASNMSTTRASSVKKEPKDTVNANESLVLHAAGLLSCMNNSEVNIQQKHKSSLILNDDKKENSVKVSDSKALKVDCIKQEPIEKNNILEKCPVSVQPINILPKDNLGEAHKQVLNEKKQATVLNYSNHKLASTSQNISVNEVKVKKEQMERNLTVNNSNPVLKSNTIKFPEPPILIPISKPEISTCNSPDKVCIVDVDTNKIIAVEPSKRIEPSQTIVITLSDDDDDDEPCPIKDGKSMQKKDTAITHSTNLSSELTSPFKDIEGNKVDYIDLTGSVNNSDISLKKDKCLDDLSPQMKKVKFLGTELLNKNIATEIRKSEVSSTSDTKTLDDHSMFIEKLNSEHVVFEKAFDLEIPNSFKQKSFEDVDEDLLINKIKNILNINTEISDDGDIVELDNFPASDEEALAYFNILKDLSMISKNESKVEEYNKKRKLNFMSLENKVDMLKENLPLTYHNSFCEERIKNTDQTFSDFETMKNTLSTLSNVDMNKDEKKIKPLQPFLSTEMLHDIVMNLNTPIQPAALPESTTNVVLPLSHVNDEYVNKTSEAFPSYPTDVGCVPAILKPVAEKILKLSADELRNILVQTQNPSSVSPQLVTSSTENHIINQDYLFPNLPDEKESFHSSDIEMSTEMQSNYFYNLSDHVNENVYPLNSTRAGNYEDRCTFTSMESSVVPANNNHNLIPDKEIITSVEFQQPIQPIKETQTKSHDFDKSHTAFDNENDCDSDSTLPYSENMDISDDETKESDSETKDIENIDKEPTARVETYTSKVEKIMERKKRSSLLKEEQMKLKKSKIISDPKLAKFCEKQREKKKAVISVINPLPMESEKIIPKKKPNKNSLSENKLPASKHEQKKDILSKKPPHKSEKVISKKKTVSKEKVPVDDASNLFKPDCKIIQKPQKKTNLPQKRPIVENEVATNASVVHYGKRTINRGTFLTEAQTEEPPPQKIRKKQTASSNSNKAVLSTERMHVMTESPQIQDLQKDNTDLINKLGFVTPNLGRLSSSSNSEQLQNISEPNKINIEEYNKRRKNVTFTNSRDPRLSAGKPPSAVVNSGMLPVGNRDCWSPASSNSSFGSSEKQNFQSLCSEGLPIQTGTNQNFSFSTNMTSHIVSNAPYFPQFTTETFQQGPSSFSQLASQEITHHQYPLPPPPAMPNFYNSSFMGQSSNQFHSFDTEASESPSFDRESPSLHQRILSPKVPSPASLPPIKKRCVSLVPKSLKASIGINFIESEKLCLSVIEWSPDWLIQQQKSTIPPPIRDPKTPLREVENLYATAEDHYNTYLPLLMLELWQRLYLAWSRSGNNVVLMCDIDSFKITTEFVKIELVSMIKDTDIEDKKCLEEGVIVIIRFVTFGGQGIKMLGFVKNAKYRHWNSDPKHDRYGENENSQMLRLSVMCVYTAGEINKQEKVKIQVLCNIKSHLKQNEALLCVRESHLGEMILKPEGDYVKSVVLSTRNSHQEAILPQIVQDILEGVTLPHPLPQLTIVKAPPSSDRITTLIRLMQEMKKIPQKVLLCTRTKSALNEIGFNLENSEFDIVIIGSKPDVHRKLRKYMLDERVHSLIKEHSFSDLHKSTKESVCRAKKVILKNCDIIVSLIQNCHNDAIADCINEDYETSMTCIIDEANLCTEPEALIPLLYRISKLILVGDPSDPAKVCSKVAIDCHYNRSFFERAYNHLHGEDIL